MSRSFFGFRRFGGLAGLLGLMALSNPAAAQSGEQVQTYANFYVISGYALGANEVCDTLLMGEYRALKVLRSRLSDDLTPVIGAEKLAEIDAFDRGKTEWAECKGAGSNTESRALMERAKLLAAGIVDAPADMTFDPAECAGLFAPKILGAADWKIAATTGATQYSSEALKPQYLGLRKGFAELIDSDCRRIGRRSNMMDAGLEAILRREDINLAAQGSSAAPKTLTEAGKWLVETKDGQFAKDIGPWRSRQGDFTGMKVTEGWQVFRLADRKDGKTMFIRFGTPGDRSPNGRAFITQQGRWIVELRNNVAQIAVTLPDRTRLPLSKISGSGSPFDGTSQFALPADAQAQLAVLAGDAKVTIVYKGAGSEPWISLVEPGEYRQQMEITLSDVRDGLAWAIKPIGL